MTRDGVFLISQALYVNRHCLERFNDDNLSCQQPSCYP